MYMEKYKNFIQKRGITRNTFVLNKSLSDISPKHCIFFMTFNLEFLYNEVWITDQNAKPLDIGDKINVTSVKV